jgi:hypothetical protein
MALMVVGSSPIGVSEGRSTLRPYNGMRFRDGGMRFRDNRLRFRDGGRRA